MPLVTPVCCHRSEHATMATAELHHVPPSTTDMLAWLSVWSLHMSQLMPLPLAVSCFSKIQIGFIIIIIIIIINRFV